MDIQEVTEIVPARLEKKSHRRERSSRPSRSKPKILRVIMPERSTPFIIKIPITVCAKKNRGDKTTASGKMRSTLRRSSESPIQMTLLIFGKRGKMFCCKIAEERELRNRKSKTRTVPRVKIE